MRILTIYHGSENIIERPIYGKGKRYNDYGLGFYCTKDLDLAKEWSVDDMHDGYVNAYRFDCTGMKILCLNGSEYCILHWLAVLLENREFNVSSSLAKESKEFIRKEFHVDYEDADVITGYRADDSYFSFAEDFLNGSISYRQLGTALRLGKLGEQFVLKSQKSFQNLAFKESEKVLREEWLKRKKQRDELARHEYLHHERYRRQRGDLYITQIMDEGIKKDDPRLQ